MSDEPPATAQLAQQRDAEQERHADCGKMAVGSALRALVEAIRAVEAAVGDMKRDLKPVIGA